MRIVVSGGWGYGNMGDDAILDSTIRVLQRRFSGCTIDVLTYDVADSSAHVAPGVRLHHCFHKAVDLGASEMYCPSISKNYSRWDRIALRLKFALTETELWFRLAQLFSDRKEITSLITGADLFVMAGGGYFNEKWLSKTRSQLHELTLANDLGIPVYIVGPTIGKFHDALDANVKQQFAKAKIITVRDGHSFAEAERTSKYVRLIPDVALSSWLDSSPSSRENVLGVVFNNLDKNLQATVAAGIAAFVQKNPAFRVDLFVSRLWKYDFIAACGVQRELQALGIATSIVLASSFRRLEEGLASCTMVVSENLHGLILAARNTVPVIAINDYAEGSPNYKKFVAFLSQSQSEKYSISSKNTAEGIAQLINDLYLDLDNRRASLDQLRTGVAKAYAEVL